jgi:hypothetical protein
MSKKPQRPLRDPDHLCKSAVSYLDDNETE